MNRMETPSGVLVQRVKRMDAQSGRRTPWSPLQKGGGCLVDLALKRYYPGGGAEGGADGAQVGQRAPVALCLYVV